MVANLPILLLERKQIMNKREQKVQEYLRLATEAMKGYNFVTARRYAAAASAVLGNIIATQDK